MQTANRGQPVVPFGQCSYQATGFLGFCSPVPTGQTNMDVARSSPTIYCL